MIFTKPANLYIGFSVILVILLSACLSMRSNAQLVYSQEDYQTAHEHLEKLQEGTLVVILKSSKKKLDLLEENMNNPQLSRSEKKRARKMHEKEQAERQYVLDSLIAAIKAFYKFSDYRFVYDTDLDSLRAGSDGYFLDENRQYDKAIELDRTRPYYYLMERYTPDLDGSRVYALVFLDDNLKVLKPPFPYFIKLIKVGPVALARLLVKKSAYVSLVTTITRLDKRLHSRLESIGNMEIIQSPD